MNRLAGSTESKRRDATMLELAVLGLLKERPMHGYELRKQLGQKLGLFWTVSFGSLYPTLRRLERRGAVAKVAEEQQTTSRRKQAYRITAAGESEFLELLEEGPGASVEQERFSLRLAFFRYLRPETRIRLLERRKAYLEDKLDEGHRSLRRAQHIRADPYTVSLVRHGVDTTAADIAWLDELITAERAGLADRPPDEARDPTRDPTGLAVPPPPPPPDDVATSELQSQ